jgi:hypothetical protein
MYSTLDLQKLVQMLAFLGISGGGGVSWQGGAIRPGFPVLYQQFFDTSIGQPVWCTQTSPAIWVNAAGVQV